MLGKHIHGTKTYYMTLKGLMYSKGFYVSLLNTLYGVRNMFGLSSICDVPKGVDSEEVHDQDGDYIDVVSGLRNGEVHDHDGTATDE